MRYFPIWYFLVLQEPSPLTGREDLSYKTSKSAVDSRGVVRDVIAHVTRWRHVLVHEASWIHPLTGMFARWVHLAGGQVHSDHLLHVVRVVERRGRRRRSEGALTTTNRPTNRPDCPGFAPPWRCRDRDRPAPRVTAGNRTRTASEEADRLVQVGSGKTRYLHYHYRCRSLETRNWVVIHLALLRNQSVHPHRTKMFNNSSSSSNNKFSLP